MKINPLTKAARFLNQVGGQKDPGDGQSPGHSGQQGSKKKHSPEDAAAQAKAEIEVEVNDERINAALDAFGKDAQNQSSGLSVSREGTGPGLRVVLKDVNGDVVRQFTGEEFLKLRASSSQDVKSRGKILDQKL